VFWVVPKYVHNVGLLDAENPDGAFYTERHQLFKVVELELTQAISGFFRQVALFDQMASSSEDLLPCHTLELVQPFLDSFVLRICQTGPRPRAALVGVTKTPAQWFPVYRGDRTESCLGLLVFGDSFFGFGLPDAMCVVSFRFGHG